MDATTNQKTLSGLLVALLVGSVLVAAVPTAAAQATNPTGSRDVIYSLETGGLTRISGDAIAFGDTVDVTFSNITGVGEDTNVNVTFGGSSIANPQQAYPDQANSGKVNVTFPALLFNAVGTYTLVADGPTTIGTFTVVASTNLQVTLSTTSFPYTDVQQTLQVTVVNLSSGTAAVGATLSIPSQPDAGTKTTDSNGVAFFTGLAPAVGDHLVVATQQYGSTGGAAEYTGNATFTVTPVSLVVADRSANVLEGFTANGVWNITYPTNSTGIISPGPSKIKAFNLSVTLPNGTVLWHNTTNGAPAASASAVGSLMFYNGSASAAAGFFTGTWMYNTTSGHFVFVPTGGWASGVYNFNLKVDTKGSGFLPEYTASWSLDPAVPSAVNLAVAMGGGSVTSLAVPAATTLTTTTGTAGTYTLTLTVTGNTATQFPLDGTGTNWDAFTAANNITVSGAILPGWTVATGTAADGSYTISGLVPTDVGGNVVISVNWKNQTTTVTIPITPGAQSSVDPAQIIVDTTTTLVVTLQDSFGNTVPNGQVFVWYEQSGSMLTWINGTGAPGLGQNGQYSLAVLPTAVGNLTIYGISGTNEGGTDNRNYTYATVRVVPAHDVNATITPNATMARQVTQYFLNATTSNGVGVPSGSSAIYFVNASELPELIANGTLPTSRFVTFTGTTAVGGDIVNAAWSAAGIHLNATLPDGTYSVYICSAFTTPVVGTPCSSAKHDNINSMPMVTVNKWDITFSPDRIASNPNIQGTTTINVTVRNTNGDVVNGTLRVYSGGALLATNTSTLTVTNGMTSFSALGANTTGSVWFEFDVTDSASAWGDTDQPFMIVGPNVQVSPDRIPVGRPATLVINVQSLTGTPLSGIPVRVCGGPLPQNCTDSVTTDATGLATVGVLPTSTGTLTLQVNNQSTPTTVAVFAGLVIQNTPSEPRAGDRLTITVQDVAGIAIQAANVTYTINGTARSQLTDANGQIVVSDVPAGNITVNATKTGFEPATKTILVQEQQVTPPTGAVLSLHDLELPDSARVGEPAQVRVSVHNDGNAAGTATLSLFVDDVFVESKQVPVDANSEVTLAFSFTPNTAGSFPVEVRLQGGESVSDTLTVATPPVTTPTTTTPTTTPTTTTPTTTSPTTTTPTTTTTTTTTPTPEVPGFEVVGLLAALGVALLVLRRRS